MEQPPDQEPLNIMVLTKEFDPDLEGISLWIWYWLKYPDPALRINIAIRLLFRISTSHWYEQCPHYEQYPQFTISTVPQKSKGTSYCSSNSYYSQQSWLFTVAVGGKSISPKWKQDSSVISAASDAPFSLYKEAHSSVFSRLKTSTTATEVHSLSSKGFHSRNTLRGSQALGIVS